MQQEAGMYTADKSWQINFAYFSNLYILNNKTVESTAYFTGNTQTTTVIFLLGSFIRSPLPFSITFFCGFFVEKKPCIICIKCCLWFYSESEICYQFKINLVKIREYLFFQYIYIPTRYTMLQH